MKLNKEELLVGFVYGSCTWPVLGWLAAIPGVICAFLWSLGGSGPKGFRRLGVPGVLGISLFFVDPMLVLVAIPLWGVLLIGYGMPDPPDKGSLLGRMYTRFLPKKAANWATRLTVFVLFNVMVIVGLAILRK